MLEPYRMILVNIISSFILLGGILFYRYIFPKRSINLFFLLILISILPIISIFRIGTYESGDLSIHVKITMGFYQSLKEGNLLPRWNGYSSGGYGGPDFIFLYILPYYLISLIHFLGISFLTSAKIFLATSFIASGITIYWWLKESFGQKSALVGAIFYQFAPYHLVDLHFRADVGEVLAFAIFPLLFVFIKQLADTGKIIFTIFFAISSTLLLLSHTTMFYTGIPLSVLYFIILWFQKSNKKRHQLFQLSFALIFCLLLSMFYWLPLISQSKFLHYGITQHIALHTIPEILYSPWRYGLLFQGHHGELSYLIGYTQLFAVVLSIFIIGFRRTGKKSLLLKYFVFSFLILCLLMLNISKPIWVFVPFMDKFMDSHRLLLPISFLISGIIGFISKYFIKKNYILFILCFFAIFTTILNWGNRRTLPAVGDSILKAELLKNTNGHDLIDPKWVDVNANWSIRKPRETLEAINGNVFIYSTPNTGTKHSYDIHLESDTLLRENTYYFPGWKVKVDGKLTPFDYQNGLFPGIITFRLPKGNYHIEVVYENPGIQKISNWISFLTFCAMLFYILFYIKSEIDVPKI